MDTKINLLGNIMLKYENIFYFIVKERNQNAICNALLHDKKSVYRGLW